VPQEERSIFWEVIVSVILSKKVYIYTFPILNGFRNRGISLYSSKIVDKKEILRTVSNTSVYCSSDKVGTVLPSVIHFRKSHRQHQCTLQHVWGHGVLLVCTVYVQWISSISETVRNRTHVHIHLLTMTDTMTFQNIDIFSWDILHMYTGLEGRGSIFNRCKKFFSIPQRPDRPWGPPRPLSNG
jgi:hypothetical protein